MELLRAYTRLLNHGHNSALSGATIPISNDHTDNNWIPTDIYDREIFINITNCHMDYRAGDNIYSPVIIEDKPYRIKQISYEIGPWDMSVTTLNADPPTGAIPFNAQVIRADAWILNDAQDTITPLLYNSLGNSNPYYLSITTAPIGIIITLLAPFANNGYYNQANSSIDYFSTSNNRGWITLQYID